VGTAAKQVWEKGEVRGGDSLIFVTIGMHTAGFERLIKRMDEIAGTINEEVVMQIGHTKYMPKNAKYFKFVTETELKRLCHEARVVVTHGAMTIIDALEQGTHVIAVPRLQKYGEHINDHQLYFVRELEKEGKVIAVYDVEKLEEALGKVDLKPPELVKDRRLVNALKKHIAEFERG
jgi:beta-1,4-N-acetylglucosaminyltransferase